MLAVMKGRELFVANAGDSRAVLGRAGTAVPLSEDHKPASSGEKQRITDAGGFVSEVGTQSTTSAVHAGWLSQPSLQALTSGRDAATLLCIWQRTVWPFWSTCFIISILNCTMSHKTPCFAPVEPA